MARGDKFNFTKKEMPVFFRMWSIRQNSPLCLFPCFYFVSCVLTERKKKYHPSLLFSTCHRGTWERRETLYKVEKRCREGGKGIKHLTKMSRVFGGWFLEGGVGGVRWWKSMPLSSSDRLWQNKGHTWKGVGGDVVWNMEERKFFYLVGSHFSPWEGGIRRTTMIVKNIQ